MAGEGAFPAASGFSVTQDHLLGGSVLLRQRARGHRAGTDAVLLAACCPPSARNIADLGAASGAVGLMAARHAPGAAVMLLEQEEALVALARENIVLNGGEGRVLARTADAFALSTQPDLREAFDVVLTNPPFFTPGRTRISPQAGRASAHHMAGDLHGWLSGVLTILAPGGEAVILHRADHLGEVLKAMSGRFGALTLRFVHPQAEAPAHRLMIAGIKGSRAPLCVLPPLVLHESGSFTPLAAALHRGEARLATRL